MCRGSTSTPAASNSSGPIAVAAAISVTIATSKFQASIADGLTVMTDATVGGSVTVHSSANSDGHAIADGSGKTKGGTVGVGAAVAINVLNVTNTATTGNATIDANGVIVQALMTDSDLDAIRRWDADKEKWVVIDSGDTLPESVLYQYEKPGTTEQAQENEDPVFLPVPKGDTLPTDPADETGDVFILTEEDGSNQPGLYKYDGAAWVAAFGTTLPGTASSGDGFQLTAQDGSNAPGYYLYDGSDWERAEGDEFPEGMLGFDIPLIGDPGEPDDNEIFLLTPADGAFFHLLEDSDGKVAGVYEFDGDTSTWVLMKTPTVAAGSGEKTVVVGGVTLESADQSAFFRLQPHAVAPGRHQVVVRHPGGEARLVGHDREH